MECVDKLFDDGDYSPNRAQRAVTMREKTLQTVEQLQVELEQTQKERDALIKELFNLAQTVKAKCDYCKNYCTLTCGVCSKGSKWEWHGIKMEVR